MQSRIAVEGNHVLRPMLCVLHLELGLMSYLMKKSLASTLECKCTVHLIMKRKNDPVLF